jgi:hypothetical protein
VKDYVDPFHDFRDQSFVSDVSLDNFDVSSCCSSGEVLPPSPAEVVEHNDFGDVLRYKEIGNMRADQSGSACD